MAIDLIYLFHTEMTQTICLNHGRTAWHRPTDIIQQWCAQRAFLHQLQQVRFEP